MFYKNSNGVFSTYAPMGGGWVQFVPLRITCKKGEGVQKACKIAYILNGRPHTIVVEKWTFKNVLSKIRFFELSF